MKESDNNLYEIKVNRASVCMGDDIDDHSMTIKLRRSCTIKGLIEILESYNFFAKVYGNNVAWTLTLSEHEIATYYTKSGKVIIIDNDYWEANKQAEPYYFEYYSPIQNRLKYIVNKKLSRISRLFKKAPNKMNSFSRKSALGFSPHAQASTCTLAPGFAGYYKHVTQLRLSAL